MKEYLLVILDCTIDSVGIVQLLHGTGMIADAAVIVVFVKVGIGRAVMGSGCVQSMVFVGHKA